MGNIVNTWAAGGKKGEGWTEITFNENKTFSATLVVCSKDHPNFEETQIPEKVVVLKGTGTWSIGQKWGKYERLIDVKWDEASGLVGSGRREDAKDQAIPADKLKRFNGSMTFSMTAGCRIRWVFLKEKQAFGLNISQGLKFSRVTLLPTDVNMTDVEDAHYYGGCEYRGNYDYEKGEMYYDREYYKEIGMPLPGHESTYNPTNGGECANIREW